MQLEKKKKQKNKNMSCVGPMGLNLEIFDNELLF